MDLEQKYIEESSLFEITAGAALDIMQFDEHDQDVICLLIASMKGPKRGVYDSFAISIDDNLILKVKVVGVEDGAFTVYRVDDIHNPDEYLDYINDKKAIKWNTDTMTLTRL